MAEGRRMAHGVSKAFSDPAGGLMQRSRQKHTHNKSRISTPITPASSIPHPIAPPLPPAIPHDEDSAVVVVSDHADRVPPRARLPRLGHGDVPRGCDLGRLERVEQLDS